MNKFKRVCLKSCVNLSINAFKRFEKKWRVWANESQRMHLNASELKLLQAFREFTINFNKEMKGK